MIISKMLEYNSYKWEILLFNKKKSLNYRFPNEKLGVGDRLLLNLVIKEQTKLFKKYEPDNVVPHNTRAMTFAIMSRIDDFGFHSIKPPMNDYRT